MIIFSTVSYILLISVNLIRAQTCTTPRNESGNCVSLYDCEPLLNLFRNKSRTAEDKKLLGDSQCGYENNIPMVCCPISNACKTPDDKPGICVGLYNCEHITYMMLDKTRKSKMDYVRQSVCNGPETFSVCCGPPPEINPEDMTLNERCSRAVTAFPLESNNECCGVEDTVVNKIVGGNDTKITQYPWLVVIEYESFDHMKLLCGGSLISSKYVLTAAHCVTGAILIEGTPKNVRLGEYNTTNNGPDCMKGTKDCAHPVVTAPIEKTIPHPDYIPNDVQGRHDIALIRLMVTAPYTDFVRPICLPSLDYTQQPPADFEMYVAGWGMYKQFISGTGLSSTVKQHVKLPYVDRDRCQAAQRTLRGGEALVITKEQLCAGGKPGEDACRGDSGGPLMYEVGNTFVMVGSVSYGPKYCGTRNIPGVYTNVYEYIPWIRSTIIA